ncbi:MAG: glycosyltransferase [Chloroflexi bacterium]|nr:glycosyltransferase [Chloroflexota bacterium]
MREKLALFSLLPYFLRRWRRGPGGATQDPSIPLTPGPSPSGGEGSVVPDIGRHHSPPSPLEGVLDKEGDEGDELVSVVVPTRNRAGLLPDLLAALAIQTYPAYEVVVVDDASDDRTPDLLAAWAGPGRLALRLDTPAGSYAARNRGWRAARGGVITFTDDDCLPQPGWLAALAAALRESDAPGVQGVTLAGPGEITPFTHQIEQRRPGPPYRTCNIAYRRGVLERLGGFDDHLRWYADNIFGLRARGLGPIAFAPEAVVNHPPRRREWRDRQAWLARFEADAAHRRELRRLGAEPITLSGRALPIVLWVLRPLVKQSWAHVRYALRHPADYRREIGPMLREKRELLRALRDFRRGATEGAEPLPPLPDRPLVSVVIVTRDRPALLGEALAALEGQTWPHREVIVVDHGGSRPTKAVADRRGARYLCQERGTLAEARQAGIDASRGEIVAFTDDDCLPDPRWLEALVHAFLRQPAIHGVQGRTRAAKGALGSRAVGVSRPDPLYQTCNIAYRRTALERVGGLDLGFAGWFEDTALGARILERGPIGFEPRALVTHRAMPRRPLTREKWRVVLEDERRLARTYPAFYRRTRGPGFALTAIGRWLVGSPVKAALRGLPRAPSDGRGYLRLLWLLARERWELIKALVDLLCGSGRS